MSENPTQNPSPQPKREPYGPGLLILFGVGLLLLAGYCTIDASTQQGRETSFIVMNWVGAVASGLAAVYCFALAVVRSRKAKAPGAGGPGGGAA